MNWRTVTVKDALVLGTYALAVGAALLIVKQWTAERIDAHQQRVLRQSLTEVLPAGPFDTPAVDNRKILSNDIHQRTVYPVYVDRQPYAVAITATAADGYAGNIELLVGVLISGEITGVRVVSHRETPGLGDKIERSKSPWIISFNGKSLADGLVWTVARNGGDFDQFTGATITPRAVVSSVKQTLDWFSRHRAQIFEH